MDDCQLDRVRDVRIVEARRRNGSSRDQLFLVCLGAFVKIPPCALPDAVRLAQRVGFESGRPVWLETGPEEYTRIDDVLSPS